MKTKLIFIFIVGFISPQVAFTQIFPSFVDFAIRGHGTEDIYIQYYSDQLKERKFYYFDHHGSHLQYSNPSWDESKPVAEIIPGELISLGGVDMSWWFNSVDYGATKEVINISPSETIFLEIILGGEYPGEYIIQGQNWEAYPYIRNVHYFTADYGSNYNLIDDTVAAFHNPEVGSLQGEMYQLPIIAGHGFICRSTDYSHTFDTTAIDTTILNSNTGLIFNTISHGATAGDLFLVIKVYDGADTLFHIYHSSDYGHSWQQKSNQIINDPDVKFTAGRAPCSFYIAHSHLNEGDEYNTLYIKYSNDCGATFTTYTYLMTPDVANQKPDKAESFASVSPNPASEVVLVQFATDARDVSIHILNTEGKSVATFEKISSAKNFSFGVSSLPAGIYFVQFYENKTLKQTSKLIVIKQ